MFRHFAELDIKEVERLDEITKKNYKVTKLDLNALVASFNGQTFFSIFENQLKLLKKVYDALVNLEYEH